MNKWATAGLILAGGLGLAGLVGLVPDGGSRRPRSQFPHSSARRQAALDEIISQEGLKPEETRAFMARAFREGRFSRNGTEITRILPPVSRFSSDGAYGKMKNRVLDRLGGYFEQYCRYGASGMARSEGRRSRKASDLDEAAREEDDQFLDEEEPEEGDYILSPTGPLGSYTGVSVVGDFHHRLGRFRSEDEAILAIKRDMDRERFWPNIWEQSDHGNLRLLTT